MSRRSRLLGWAAVLAVLAYLAGVPGVSAATTKPSCKAPAAKTLKKASKKKRAKLVAAYKACLAKQHAAKAKAPVAKGPTARATPAAPVAAAPAAPVAAAPATPVPAAAPVAAPTAVPTAVPTVAPVVSAPATAAGQRLFTADYDLAGGTTLSGIWRVTQVPSVGGVPQPDRISVTDAPGDAADALRPAGKVMRVELRPYDNPAIPGPADGDVTVTSGYSANRAEVYDRIATRTTALAAWPDPLGSERWYSWSVFFPADFPTDGDKWFDFTQWKGLDTGSPPIAMELDGNQIELGGKNVRRTIGTIQRGRWMHFTVGMKFSNDPAVGWVTVALNGATVVPPTPAATMNDYWKDSANARVIDPDYLKQGIYRSASWTVTQVLYFSPMQIGTTRDAVG